MKRLRFVKLWLMSRKERAAFSVAFDPELTVIIGENDTGKSSLIKSLYWTFGADAARVHPTWKDAAVIGMLRFAVDGVEHTIVRDGARFGIFDAAGNLLLATSKITKELAPFVAKMLDFKLLLSDRDGNPRVPPPAFCFLPFYVDQDVGWQQPWQSFANLGQFPNFKRDVISYHSGIRPNEYYDLKTQANQKKIAQREFLDKRKVVSEASQKLRETFTVEGLTFDESEYEDSIHRLLTDLKSLREKRAAYAAMLSDAVARRTDLDEQLSIARNALAEFDEDVKWLGTHVAETVMCPVCGTNHENSFANRFAIIEDREACRSFMFQTITKIDTLKEEIEAGQHRLKSAETEIARIDGTLNEKRGEIKLRDVIVAEGQRQAITIFDSEIESLTFTIEEFDAEIAEIERQLKELSDPKRKEMIEAYYSERVQKNLRVLDVQNVRPRDFEKLDQTVRDTGSDQPRAVLAYDLAFVSTLEKFSSSVSAPIVIDSPNQQDQDTKNARAMMSLIFSERPSKAQLILGTVSLHGAQTSGLVVKLEEKSTLLKKSHFNSVESEIAPFLEIMF